MPPLEELEKARDDIPASMRRLLNLRTLKAEDHPSSPQTRLILTPQGEVLGLMAFEPNNDADKCVFRLSLRNNCPSQWLEILDLEKTPQSISSSQENPGVRGHRGIFNLYNMLFINPSRNPGHGDIVTDFITDLLTSPSLNDLST